MQPHLLHVVPSFAIGGAQVRLAQLVNAFGGRYRHTVVSLDGDSSCRARLCSDVTAELVLLVARKSGTVDLQALRDIRRFLTVRRPDLLLTYNWGSIEWAMVNRLVSRAPHVHHEDGFGPEEATGKQLARRILFRRLALGRRATRIVVPSRTLERVATETWRLPAARVIRIANGIDCARFARTADAVRSAADPDPVPDRREIVVGTLGALRPEKNFARLVRCFAEAVKQDGRLRLVMAGDGPERSALERLAVERGVADRIAFRGIVSCPEEFLATVDIFALSSDTEQMPYTVIEAMAAGLSIVSTNVGDVPDMISPDNRHAVVQADDEVGFAGSLLSLSRDVRARRRIGAANREKAFREYPLERMCETYDRLFLGLLSPLCGELAREPAADRASSGQCGES